MPLAAVEVKYKLLNKCIIANRIINRIQRNKYKQPNAKFNYIYYNIYNIYIKGIIYSKWTKIIYRKGYIY
jgi:hypothetical protein